MTTALIDGDIVVYRCAAANENAEPPLAAWQTDQLLNRIIEDVNAADWHIYISGENNFRYRIYPEYKANRPVQRPRHLEYLREYLVTSWNAVLADGCEADDLLGINQRRYDKDTIICSIDKDLLQLPGRHYNFVRRTLVDISEAEGEYNFYYQLLVGDATDNIKGCPGVGPVTAKKLLENPNLSYFKVCVEAYKDAFRKRNLDGWEASLLMNARLLWIQREEEQEWNFPEKLELTEEHP